MAGKPAEVAEKAEERPMTDAIELLRRDHDEVRALLSELEASADPVRPGDREGRRTAVVQVIIRESVHEAIEEQYFWPVVRRRVHDGGRLADQAVSQGTPWRAGPGADRRGPPGTTVRVGPGV
jgi:hemerythrin HHE cation binding domain-containing protein